MKNIALLLTVVLVLQSGIVLADNYDDFNAFALTAFGAEKDDLIYQKFGYNLQIFDYWEHVSQNSAAISFSTNLPAHTYIEYGTTTSYGSSTLIDDRRYYQHLHYIKNLDPGTTYHYRIVSEDERGNIVYSSDRIVTPQIISGVIRIPQDMSGPPYNLNTANAYYLVTQDITLNGRAFNMNANGITLDLGGNTVIYNNANMPISGTFVDFIRDAAFGVISGGPDNFKVVNGRLKQGVGQNSAQPSNGIGFNPIYIESSGNVEIAGTILEYTGNQVTGIYSRYGGGNYNIHNNIFLDRGSGITNRHNAVKSLTVENVRTNRVHHNLIKRTRQAALTGGIIYDNEVYIDSYATNSIGVWSLSSNRDVYNNKIFGTGYHVVGLGWGGYNHMYNNFINLVGQGPDNRFPEYGNQESLNGIRLTQYNGATEDYSNNIYEDNLVIISGGACHPDGNCTKTRGLQYFSDIYVRNNIIRNNIIKVVMNDVVTFTGALATEGSLSRCGQEYPVVYEENTIISNFANIILSDDYGQGCNHQFFNNHLIKVGNRADYTTFKFGSNAPVNEHYFYDTTLEGGASFDSTEFTVAGQEFKVGWTLTVLVTDGTNPVLGASVTLKDVNGNIIGVGITDVNGVYSSLVLAYLETINGRTYSTPTEIIVNYNSNQVTQVTTVDRKKTVTVSLGVPEPAIMFYSGMGSDTEIFQPQIFVDQMPSLTQAVVESNAGDITYEQGAPGMPGLAARIDGYQPDYEFAVFDIDNFDFSDSNDDGGRIDYWIKFLNDPHAGGKNVFIARTDGIIAGPPYWFFTMEYVRSGYPYFEFLGGSPRSGTTGRLVVHPDSGSWSGWADIQAGEWHLFTLTWRRNGPERDRAELHFYIDGTNEGCSGCNDYNGNLAPENSMSKLIFNDYNIWGGQVGPDTTMQFSLDEFYSFDRWGDITGSTVPELYTPNGITLAYPYQNEVLEQNPTFEFITLNDAYQGACFPGSFNDFSCELFVNDISKGTFRACNNQLKVIDLGENFGDGQYSWYLTCAGLPNSVTSTFSVNKNITICGEGNTQICQTSESCAGTQTCSANAWGVCIDTPDDNCPIIPDPPVVNFVNPIPDDATITTDFEATVDITGGLSTFTWNWDSTPYNIIDSATAVLSNFNNVIALGEDTGTVVNVANTAFDGTLSGGATYVLGVYGSAIDLTGGGTEQVSFGDIPLMTSSNTDIIAASMWLKESTEQGGGTQRYILAKDVEFFFGYDQYNELTIGTWGSNIDTTICLNPVTNTWYHVYFEYDEGAGTLKIYVNGELNCEGTTTDFSSDTLAPLRLGMNSNAVTATEIVVDDLYVFTKALTEEEIKIMFKSSFEKYDITGWNFYIKESNLVAGSYVYSASVTNSVGTASTGELTVNVGSACPGIYDFIGCGIVNINDLLDLASRFGQSGLGDYDSSGSITILDLIIHIKNWD